MELQEVGEVTLYTNWLVTKLPDGASTDTTVDTPSLAVKRQLETAFATKSIRLDIPHGITDAIWADRLALPRETAFPHDTTFVSEAAVAKLTRVCAAIKG